MDADFPDFLSALCSLVFTACPTSSGSSGGKTTPTTPTTTPATVNATLTFPTLTDGPTIDFSPNESLPTGVTYILKDNKGHEWNSASGFNGQVTITDHYNSSSGDIDFTQTFYLNGVEITGDNSKRIVKTNYNPFDNIFTVLSDTGSVTLKHP